MSEHKKWCDSVTKILTSDPPQVPPCNCGLTISLSLTEEEIRKMEGVTFLKQPELSEWKCELFGTTGGMTLHPTVEQVPNWFWRKMQFLVLGNRWIKEVSDV